MKSGNSGENSAIVIMELNGLFVMIYILEIHFYFRLTFGDDKINNTPDENEILLDENKFGFFNTDTENSRVFFETENNTSVLSQTGSTALISCIVKNIGDGVVSWIRRKDYHLLTVGSITYSSDDRFSSIHRQNSEIWSLQIKYVQRKDAGFYECQVSSHPPTGVFIHLIVVEARATILGPTEKYINPGSELKLECVVQQTTEPSAYVFWFHNNRMINYDSDRGINVTTDGTSNISILTVLNADMSHSGNYSCVPSNAQPASKFVHIFNGEHPAAMQQGGQGLTRFRCSTCWIFILTFAILTIL